MASSLTNLVNNLPEGLYRKKCKLRHDDKNCALCGIKDKYCDCFVEYTNFKDYLIKCKCLYCKENYQQKFNENWKERFFNLYKFSNHYNNKFVLLLRKGVYPYKYMDNLEKYNETSLPEKKYIYIYNHLNMEVLLMQIMHTQQEFVKVLK